MKKSRQPATPPVREVAIHYRRRRQLPEIVSAADVARFVRSLADGAREHILAIYLDSRHAPIGWQVVSVGTASSSLVHPREIFQPAVMLGACALLLAHNHPSGMEKPSPEDHEVTRRVFDAGHLLGIQLLDHVVVSDEKALELSRA